MCGPKQPEIKYLMKILTIVLNILHQLRVPNLILNGCGRKKKLNNHFHKMCAHLQKTRNAQVGSEISFTRLQTTTSVLLPGLHNDFRRPTEFPMALIRYHVLCFKYKACL